MQAGGALFPGWGRGGRERVDVPGAIERGAEGAGEVRGAAGRDEEAGDAVGDDVRDPANVGGDDRAT